MDSNKLGVLVLILLIVSLLSINLVHAQIDYNQKVKIKTIFGCIQTDTTLKDYIQGYLFNNYITKSCNPILLC